LFPLPFKGLSQDNLKMVLVLSFLFDYCAANSSVAAQSSWQFEIWLPVSWAISTEKYTKPKRDIFAGKVFSFKEKGILKQLLAYSKSKSKQ
jgi:hypothetical protein